MTALEGQRPAADGEYLAHLLAPVPPTSPGDPNGAPERDPADNFGPAVLIPSVAGSPHWAEQTGGA